MTITQPWTDLLQGLDAALALCNGLGLNDHVAGGRFPVYRQHLAQLIAALEGGGQPAAFTAFEADRLLSIVTLTESAELADLVPFFETVPAKTLHDKLVHVLGRPVLPTDEDKNSSHARNILFELNLASKFWRAGLNPQLGEEPDLSIDIEGKRFLFQCKRPSSFRAAQRSLSSAKDQIRANLKTAPVGARGVIALSLTKLLNRGDHILRYTSELRARQELSDQLEDASERVRSKWSGPGGSIVGMVCHVISPGIDETVQRWMVVQQTNVHGFAQPGSLDDRLFRSAYGALAKIWY